MALPGNFNLFYEYNEGKLYGSSEPGRVSNTKYDKEILALLRTIKTERPVFIFNQDLQQRLDHIENEMKSIHDQHQITSIYSVASGESDGYPQLLKYIWENKLGYGDYIIELQDTKIAIKDFEAPTLKQLQLISTDANEKIKQGKKVLVHCGAGIGRTGTILAAIYMKLANVDCTKAIEYTKNTYHSGSVESFLQKDSLTKLDLELKKEKIVELQKIYNLHPNEELQSKIFNMCIKCNEREAAKLLCSPPLKIELLFKQYSTVEKKNILEFMIEEGLNQQATECLKLGTSPNIICKDGKSLFAKALLLNDEELLKAFYTNPKFEINTKDVFGKSSLDYATEINNPRIIKELIIRGATKENFVLDQSLAGTYLKDAIDIENLNGITSLLRQYPVLYDHPIEGNNLNKYLKKNNFLSLAIYSFDQSGDLEQKQQAIEILKTNPKLIKDLILSDINLNYFKNDQGQLPKECQNYTDKKSLITYIKEAADNESIEHIFKLSKFDPSLMSANRDDQIKTADLREILSGQDSVLNYLIKNTNNQALSLQLAQLGFKSYEYSSSPERNVIDLAIDLKQNQFFRPQDLTKLDNYSQIEILHKAIMTVNEEITSALLANIDNIHKNIGTTSLIEAVKVDSSSKAILNLVLSKKISSDEINESDTDGKNALMWAVEKTSPSAINKIIKTGLVDKTHFDLAIAHARDLNKPGMLKILEEAQKQQAAIKIQSVFNRRKSRSMGVVK